VFDTVLVANRGEIAVRVISTLKRLGIRAVAVYSDADAAAPHTMLADQAVRLGPAPAQASYLAIDRILDAAARARAQAVHPGYGFLAESAEFARAVAAAGLTFVGPPPEAIEAMGDKIRAKRYARDAGVPLLPGVEEPGLTDAALVDAAGRLGYPLLVKAAAGGGGKGMRIVREAAELPDALAAARREARSAFGDDQLLLERYVDRPRHVEIQVLADSHGTCVHLGERECSLQRRYQKVIEEAPSPRLDQETRERMGAASVALSQAVGYTGVGTVEYLVADGDFFFLEMNTRLQVEHPVTEEVYRLDLVEQQLRVAAGERLAHDQAGLVPQGHAIEARVYAEDPDRGFLPTGGRVLALGLPGDVRLDLGIDAGSVVGSDYDPMLGKVITWGPDRAAALRRLDAALAEVAVLGVTTNVAFLRRLLADEDVQAGRLDTGLIARLLERMQPHAPPDEAFAVAALAELARLEPPPGTAVDPFDVPTGWRIGAPGTSRWRLATPGGRTVEVAVQGRAADALVALDGGPQRRASLVRHADGSLDLTLDGSVSRWLLARESDVSWLGREGGAWPLRYLPLLTSAAAAADAVAAGPLLAPLPGTVTLVAVTEGEHVTTGQTILVLEAMKMEHPITAPIDGVVAKLVVQTGQQVPIDAELAIVEPS
jgi:3-methylcrotonyl-CoA carboxylase alpha subunit